MVGIGSSTAEVAALVATLVSVVAAVPQLHRVIARHDQRGVSVASATLGFGTELAWIAYASSAGLTSALPEAIAMAGVDITLATAQVLRGAACRRALTAGVGWIIVLAMVGAIGGVRMLGAVVGVGYVVQVAPAVWTVWTTASPSGVAAATWSMVGIEGLLWGVYGLHHGDPATSCFAVVAIVAAAMTLARKLAVRPLEWEAEACRTPRSGPRGRGPLERRPRMPRKRWVVAGASGRSALGSP